MKKVLCLLLCLALVLICTPVSYAQDHTEAEPTSQQYISYVNDAIAKLANLPDVDFSESGVSISQPIEILNDNDESNYAFFLFDQNTCIGELVVGYIDNIL